MRPECTVHPPEIRTQRAVSTMDRDRDLQPPLTEAIHYFHATWNSDRDKSKQLTEASVEVAEMHIKAGIYDDAATKAQFGEGPTPRIGPVEPHTPSSAA